MVDDVTGVITDTRTGCGELAQVVIVGCGVIDDWIDGWATVDDVDEVLNGGLSKPGCTCSAVSSSSSLSNGVSGVIRKRRWSA